MSCRFLSPSLFWGKAFWNWQLIRCASSCWKSIISSWWRMSILCKMQAAITNAGMSSVFKKSKRSCSLLNLPFKTPNISVQVEFLVLIWCSYWYMRSINCTKNSRETLNFLEVGSYLVCTRSNRPLDKIISVVIYHCFWNTFYSHKCRR